MKKILVVAVLILLASLIITSCDRATGAEPDPDPCTCGITEKVVYEGVVGPRPFEIIVPELVLSKNPIVQVWILYNPGTVNERWYVLGDSDKYINDGVVTLPGGEYETAPYKLIIIY